MAILVGAGALHATDKVIAVAERLNAGVAKALLGKAALPDTLPYVTGSLGLLGTKPSWDLMKAAIDVEVETRHGRDFALLTQGEQDVLLATMQAGEVGGPRWTGLDAKSFFERGILADIPALYYSLPDAWNEIGFGGPASPRGYVRLDGDRPDPWEAIEAAPGGEARAGIENRHVV